MIEVTLINRVSDVYPFESLDCFPKVIFPYPLALYANYKILIFFLLLLLLDILVFINSVKNHETKERILCPFQNAVL